MTIDFYHKNIGELDQKMVDYFYRRTNTHIDRVCKYMDLIYDSDPKRYYLLPSRKELHDLSKYKKPELIPYIYLTWKYYCQDNKIKFVTSDDLEHMIQVATYHHVKNNRHHPEYHDDNTTINSINSKDRDKPPEKMVDGSKMSETDIAEMCADWMAMSFEKGGQPKDWADSNVNKRWSFNKNQVEQIYEILKLYK